MNLKNKHGDTECLEKKEQNSVFPVRSVLKLFFLIQYQCHSRERGNPVLFINEIPACAGMTGWGRDNIMELASIYAFVQ